MEYLLNDGWMLADVLPGTLRAEVLRAQKVPVDLPHDALIGDTTQLYRDCDLWYFRTLKVTDEMLEHVVRLSFDGVYMDCDVWADDRLVCSHRYGYTSFQVDLTDRIHHGEVAICVCIRHRHPNSRWYTGAGIYRDVKLQVFPRRYLEPDGIYATTREIAPSLWQVDITAEIIGAGNDAPIIHRLLDTSGQVVAEEHTSDGRCTLTVSSPAVWDVSDPVCYTLESSLPGQTVTQHIGFRTVTFTPDRGMLLNYQPIKLHGVCLHHDLGALGSAFHRKAEERRLRIMQEMGVNAIRTAHNPPAPQTLDLCDELGILVVDEAFDTWNYSKGKYDYSRFFADHWREDVASWVRRDRNHPCVIMWSIGNEILDTNVDPDAADLTMKLTAEVALHDPAAHAMVTMGSNFMAWENARRCADKVALQGYNYGEKLYAQHHQGHPDWVIYGSETSSMVSSRGIYHFPMSANILSDEDLQCSELGNSATSWGTQDLQKCIVEDLNTPYSMGQFLWSGMDYIGEPTPYHTRNSYFGMADTAGFPKEAFYRFKSAWTREPMVHIGVTWDWNMGQLIDIPVMSNAYAVTLYVNDFPLGTKIIDPTDPAASLPVWQSVFVPGKLRAVAYDAQHRVIAEDIRYTPGETAALKLVCHEESLLTDGEDLAFVTIQAIDAQGHPVDNAGNNVQVLVSGGGRLMGLDNGDSTSDAPYQTTVRHLFSGKLLAIIGSNGCQEDVRIVVRSKGLPDAELILPVRQSAIRPGVSCHQQLCPERDLPTDMPVRRINLIAAGSASLTPEHPDLTMYASMLPACADDQPVTWHAVNAAGITSPCVQLTPRGRSATIHGVGDGTVYVRAMVNNGADHPRVISHMEIQLSEFGTPNLDPYSFISAGVYSGKRGEVTAGNEQGVAFARDGESEVWFDQVDFGAAGSDRVTLPVFALDDKLHEIFMFAGEELIAVLPYQKPCRWNVYQSETYTLPMVLTGLQTIRFRLNEKLHLKGFQFERQSRAWRYLTAAQANSIYGDSFTRSDSAILDIGNNVTLTFDGLDFGAHKQVWLHLDGATPLTTTPITLTLSDADGNAVSHQLLFDFQQRGVRSYALDIPGGTLSASFVFLPGCRFDFYGLQFTADEDHAY